MPVVHCKRSMYDVYIGRANGSLPQSKWHNPFVVGIHGTREECIAAYSEYLAERLEKEPDLMQECADLDGLTLGCWCSPKPCHGDTLLHFAKLCKGILNGTIQKQ